MKSKILIVDDDWSILEMLKFTLNTSGYEVVAAQNCDDFFKTAWLTKPDVIILDIMLGDRDGVQAYEELLTQGFDPKIPVVFLSVLAQDITPTPPQKGRTYALIAKPFDPGTLVQQIDCLVGRD